MQIQAEAESELLPCSTMSQLLQRTPMRQRRGCMRLLLRWRPLRAGWIPCESEHLPAPVDLACIPMINHSPLLQGTPCPHPMCYCGCFLACPCNARPVKVPCCPGLRCDKGNSSGAAAPRSRRCRWVPARQPLRTLGSLLMTYFILVLNRWSAYNVMRSVLPQLYEEGHGWVLVAVMKAAGSNWCVQELEESRRAIERDRREAARALSDWEEKAQEASALEARLAARENALREREDGFEAKVINSALL